jgi:hypothetical protein
MDFKFLLSLVVGIVMSINSFGQFALVRLTVGSVFSNPTVKGLEGFKKKSYTDGVLSLEGTYQFESNWGVVLDVGVCNRGMTLLQPITVSAFNPYTGETTFSDKTNKYKHGFFYLDNTLMARYITGKKKTKAYANAGIYYSMLLKARKLIVDEYYDYSGYGGISEVHNKYQDQTNYNYNGADLGLAFGAGVQYGRFGIDFRYNLGVAQISKHKEDFSLRHSYAVLRITGVCFKSRSPLFRGNGLIKRKK